MAEYYTINETSQMQPIATHSVKLTQYNILHLVLTLDEETEKHICKHWLEISDPQPQSYRFFIHCLPLPH